MASLVLKRGFGRMAGVLAILGLAWPATAEDKAVFGPDLARSWTVVELLGAKPVEGIEVTVEIGADGMLSGNGGCNRFTGTMIRNGDGVKVSPLAATRRYCLGPITDQESSMLKRMEDIDGVKIGEDGLLTMSAGDTPVIKARIKQQP